MGYSHCFEEKRISWDQWEFFVERVEEILRHKPDGLELDVDISMKPSDAYISINGIDEGQHENLFIDQEGNGHGSRGFAFCKTARKPYDIIVGSILIVYDQMFSDGKKGNPGYVSSDGWMEDWSDVLQFSHYVSENSPIINSPFQSRLYYRLRAKSRKSQNNPELRFELENHEDWLAQWTEHYIAYLKIKKVNIDNGLVNRFMEVK